MKRSTVHPEPFTLALALALLPFSGCREDPGERAIILATTTSTQDSGLLDELVPLFEETTGYGVKTIAVGTGEALAMGRRGDADVLLVHAPDRERALVAEGFALRRRLVMHNDFLIVGPPEDPAGIRGWEDGARAMGRIAESGAPFVSRGDDSGTHMRELSLWDAAGLEPGGPEYLSVGQGMGATLLIAAEGDAYVLTDRGTYLALKDRTGLVPLVERDPLFLNLYSVMEVSPQRHPGVNGAGARAFSDFLLSPETQEVIRAFGMERFGEPLFIPDAGRSEESLLPEPASVADSVSAADPLPGR